jgi:hypothetical protein
MLTQDTVPPYIVPGWLLFVAIALLVAAVALSVWSAREYQKMHRLILDGVVTAGEVVALIPKRGSKGGTTWAPQVRYRPVGAVATLEFTSNYSSKPPAYKLGERVRIVYEASDPTNARIDSWFTRTALVFLPAIGAVLASSVAVWFLAAANIVPLFPGGR